uniref:(California timema) hypothetical protein n=1 Tax=Timema californicum TaxID=61474 RepID=A0A7R9P6J4_TIMCA|nr:unnamed protein product [Timema californicum]
MICKNMCLAAVTYDGQNLAWRADNKTSLCFPQPPPFYWWAELSSFLREGVASRARHLAESAKMAAEHPANRDNESSLSLESASGSLAGTPDRPTGAITRGAPCEMRRTPPNKDNSSALYLHRREPGPVQSAAVRQLAHPTVTSLKTRNRAACRLCTSKFLWQHTCDEFTREPLPMYVYQVIEFVAGDKSGSPRVTLRLHQIKARDEKRLAKVAATAEVNTTHDNNRAQLTANMEDKEDVYEFKSGKEPPPDGDKAAERAASNPSPPSLAPSTDTKKEVPARVSPARQEIMTSAEQPTPLGKRSLADTNDGVEEGEEESRRKKRKDASETGKENPRNGGASRVSGGRNGTAGEKGSKASGGSKCTSGAKGTYGSAAEEEGDTEEGKGSAKSGPGTESSSSSWVGGPKVPPLKIVIPQQSTTLEQEQGNRNGKNGASRHHQALPYVVASSNSESSEKDGVGSASSGNPSPTESNGGNSKCEEKKESSALGTAPGDEKQSTHHQRVLRSSHRSSGGSKGGEPSSSGNNAGSAASSPGAPDRGSNNSSPQQHRQTPSPPQVTTPAVESPSASKTPTPSVASPTAPPTAGQEEKVLGAEPREGASPPQPPAPPQPPPPVELHPRKRKMKQSKEAQPRDSGTASTSDPGDSGGTSSDVHPHEQPITNCYQLFLNIRKQIERRRKSLFPVQPKPPQGFKDYLMNKCTYVLAGNASSRMSVPQILPPASLPDLMKGLFVEQEKERYRLRMQHMIEKEKLVLSVEQEILRVHGRAARALANQSLPFSVCTILKDEEVYNVITPEQEEKDRNARSRYNGRLFISWLQDVDDKWEKIKETMLIRHHNEAQSLYAVQTMDWEWKMKEMGVCEFKCKPVIDDLHVPMVHVSDDFDLLPA